ncbi:unnamed protein product [Amoebophrya sp. A120]|nr:unnamed protein product [Amoebophrya sp. A120]|eukprot:GSA120T00008642001.1
MWQLGKNLSTFLTGMPYPRATVGNAKPDKAWNHGALWSVRHIPTSLYLLFMVKKNAPQLWQQLQTYSGLSSEAALVRAFVFAAIVAGSRRADEVGNTIMFRNGNKYLQTDPQTGANLWVDRTDRNSLLQAWGEAAWAAHPDIDYASTRATAEGPRSAQTPAPPPVTRKPAPPGEGQAMVERLVMRSLISATPKRTVRDADAPDRPKNFSLQEVLQADLPTVAEKRNALRLLERVASYTSHTLHAPTTRHFINDPADLWTDADWNWSTGKLTEGQLQILEFVLVYAPHHLEHLRASTNYGHLFNGIDGSLGRGLGWLNRFFHRVIAGQCADTRLPIRNPAQRTSENTDAAGNPVHPLDFWQNEHTVMAKKLWLSFQSILFKSHGMNRKTLAPRDMLLHSSSWQRFFGNYDAVRNPNAAGEAYIGPFRALSAVSARHQKRNARSGWLFWEFDHNQPPADSDFGRVWDAVMSNQVFDEWKTLLESDHTVDHATTLPMVEEMRAFMKLHAPMV